MKVLFIYYDTASSEPPRIGFGVAYLSAFLKKHGHYTKLCYFRSNEDVMYTLSTIKKWEPDIIAHSSTSSSFYSVGTVAKKIRDSFPGLFQICGGNHVSLCPDELVRLPEFDAICIGYGEYPLLELVEAIQEGRDYRKIENLFIRHGGEIIKNPQRQFPTDLDSFMPCDREMFIEELKRFSIPVPFNGIFGYNMQEFIFCRGCPFDCSFCCNHILKTLGHGKYINFPSVSKCIEELEQVKRDMKMTGVAIHDDIFTLKKSWFREFAEEYRKRISLPYVCNLRVNCFNEDDVKYLKNSGCVIAILGIESGNEYIRNEIMRKGIKQEDIIKAYDLLHKYGIKTHSQNLIGVPCETPELFLDTIRINARIMPNHASLSIFYPYRGTVLYDRCKNENLFVNSGNDKQFQERRDTKLKLPDFPRKYILFYIKNFSTLIKYEHCINKHRFLKRFFSLYLWNQSMIAIFMGIFHRSKLLLSWILPKYPEKA
jgi:radical SAM superfamily enzyme YgiQ (UPF0313 family)